MKANYVFGGIPAVYSAYDQASVLLQPIPYDGTSTWGKGADRALEAFIEASEQLELYDIETDSEVYEKGIHVLPPIEEKSSPEALYQIAYEQTRELLKTNKFLSFLGGEHSISIGIIDAMRERHSGLSVLQLDAHADLRPSYQQSPYNHACAMHKARIHTNLIQVGIRSMDISEKPFMDYEKCFFAHDMHNQTNWMEASLSRMTEKVYLTIDLDVLDPSIMPATGTPEPGGMDWYTLLNYLKRVFSEKNVVGFDIVELAPISGLHAPAFLVAKLYYKLLSYKFYG